VSLSPSSGPTDDLPPFRFAARMRVGFDETDAQAVVYYGRYLPYFDRARVEYQRHLGLLHGLPEPLEFVMRRSSQEYEAPARFDDMLEVFVRIARIGRTSTTFEFRVRKLEDGTLLVVGDQVQVLIDANSRKPTEIPLSWRRVIERFEGAL
jgi:acyl-CoA thioester hydrolase